MPRGTVLRSAVAVSVFLMPWIAAPAFAAPEATLAGPEALEGDGRAEATFVLTLPAGAGEESARIDVDTDAGTVGRVRRVAPGRFEFPFVPPRVAVDSRIEIRARVEGRGDLAARHVVALSAPAAAADRQRSSGPLGIEAPAFLALGVDATAIVRVRRAPANGAIVAHASAGTLSAFRAAADGALEATYTPPDARYPQVAVLAFTDSAGAVADLIAIPLHGQAKIEVKTEPSAQAVLRVAEVEYGPFRADRKGILRAVVLAPPGVETGHTLVTDRLGNRKEAPFALGAPPFGRIASICPDETGRMLVFAADARGAPAASLPIEVAASEGTLSSPRALAPGIYRAELSPEPGSPEVVTLTARIASEPSSVAECRPRVPGEMPVAVEISLDREAYRAGSGTPIAITVRMKYPGRGRAQGIPMDLQAELGEVSSLARVDPRTWTGRWTLPDRWGGKDRVALRVRAQPLGEGAVPLVSETAVRLEPGPVARLEVRSRPGCGSRAPGAVAIVAQAYDQWENPASGTLGAHAAGTVSPFADTGAGVYRASYRAPARSAAAEDVVVIREQSTRLERSVTVPLPAPVPRYAVTGRVGYVSAGNRLSSPLVMVGVQIPVPAVHDSLSLGLESGFYASRRAPVPAAPGSGFAQVSGVPFLLKGSWRLAHGPEAHATAAGGPCAPGAGVYLGGGGGMLAARSRDAGGSTTNHTAAALSAHLGADFVVGPGRLVVEAGHWHAPADGFRLDGNLAGSSLSFGYRSEF